jgi:glutathione S-transferase
VIPILYIGNRNYSSWSLRPWLVLRWSDIEFETRAIALGGAGYGLRQMPDVLAISSSGTVPALHLGSEVIGDSLAISEWVAEQNRALWPADPAARAYARSAVCEMHSGFGAIRSNLPCNIRRRAGKREFSVEVQRELARIEQLWTELRARFGTNGPYLFGAKSIADAFFTPMATRLRTYEVALGTEARRYADTLLADAAFLEWERAAEAETWTIPQWENY